MPFSDAMIGLISKVDASGFIIKQASSKLSDDELFKRINIINKKKGVAIQVFDCESIAGKIHLMGAYLNALSAFRNHTNRTKSVSMEMLLFAAMTDQITAAIDAVGARKSSKLVVFSSSKKAFGMVSPLLKDIGEFNPTRQHASKALKKFGIKDAKNTNRLLLQRMAISRLGK